MLITEVCSFNQRLQTPHQLRSPLRMDHYAVAAALIHNIYCSREYVSFQAYLPCGAEGSPCKLVEKQGVQDPLKQIDRSLHTP